MGLQANKPRFSVIIIGYNVENYIKRAIDSVEKQDEKNMEIIVVDDCSTDNTKKIIEGLADSYGNIVFKAHKANKKAGGARNTRPRNGNRRIHCIP